MKLNDLTQDSDSTSNQRKSQAHLRWFLTESQGQSEGMNGASCLSSTGSFSPSDAGFPLPSDSSLKKSILCASLVRFSDMDSCLKHKAESTAEEIL